MRYSNIKSDKVSKRKASNMPRKKRYTCGGCISAFLKFVIDYPIYAKA
jgi:hypothetical protein